MNEIEKLYENAEVKKQIPKLCSSNELYCKECEAYIEDVMPYCKNAEYPPFTAEKQLELIKWLINEVDYITMWHFNNSEKPYDFDLGSRNSGGETFEDALAQMINNLWQDLTEEEKQQIKEILE